MAAVSAKPVLEVDTVQEWEAWLAAHPDDDGVRLRLRKKASTRPGITYAEALDGALCFGWIDGQIAALDDDYHLQVFTPRRPRSRWSQRNREHVARLTEQGRMRPAGLAEVERAQGDGRWDAAYRATPVRHARAVPAVVLVSGAGSSWPGRRGWAGRVRRPASALTPAGAARWPSGAGPAGPAGRG